MRENQGKNPPNFRPFYAVILCCLFRASGWIAAADSLELPVVSAFPHRLPAEVGHRHPLFLLKEPGEVLSTGKPDPRGDFFHLQFGKAEIEADLFQSQLLDMHSFERTASAAASSPR